MSTLSCPSDVIHFFNVQIGSIVGTELKPSDKSSLRDMLEAGLSDYSHKYA